MGIERGSGKGPAEEDRRAPCTRTFGLEGFALAFQLYRDNSRHIDLGKISNMGWQGGTHTEAIESAGA